MRLYSSSQPLYSTPDVSTLKLIGQRTIRTIDFRDADDFRKVRALLASARWTHPYICRSQFVPSMPNDNVAGEFFGQLNIVKKGSYTLCTISDDG